jgi:hypothetical protein
MKPAAWFAAAVLISLCLPSTARAQDVPLGAPQPAHSVRDPEFGVVARHFGLERRVEMLQWQRRQDRYSRVWSEQPIDSARFAADRQNPPAIPLRSRRWLAAAISVDGKPLDPEVVTALGRWQAFRPSFSALPGNLAATFQPEGDGLGSAENPLEPRIGDLRVHWRELVLPPLDGRIELRDGRWQLRANPPVSATVAVDTDANEAASAGAQAPRRWWWVAAIAALVLCIAALVAWRRRQPH